MHLYAKGAACVAECPSNAISGEKKEVHVIDQELCSHCGNCVDAVHSARSVVEREDGTVQIDDATQSMFEEDADMAVTNTAALAANGQIKSQAGEYNGRWT